MFKKCLKYDMAAYRKVWLIAAGAILLVSVFCGLGIGGLITADRCARRGLAALWRGERCSVPDWWNRVWIPFLMHLPMWMLRPLRRYTNQFQK